MKTKDIRELSTAELDKQLRETREELLQLRLRKQTGQLENPLQIRTTRRDIARMETILQEKQGVEASA